MDFYYTILQGQGVDTEAILTWDGTTRNTEHKVKTAHRVTDAKYSYTEEDPIYGPGQGS